MSDKDKIDGALAIALRSGGVDGEHHKAWVIDQMIRALTGSIVDDGRVIGDPTDAYREWRRQYAGDLHGPDVYTWDEGIAP